MLLSGGPPDLARAGQLSRVDRGDALEMFNQLAQEVQKRYYDQTFHGFDWNGTVTETRQRIRGATSVGMALADIAAALEALGDSHTFFYPPSRTCQCDYGIRAIMVGERCYISRVRPGSDAERRGVQRGDEVKMLDDWVPQRESIWRTNYLYNILLPQTGLRLLLATRDGRQRPLMIAAKIERFDPFLDLAPSSDDTASASVRRAENFAEQSRPRTASLGGTLYVLKLPAFAFDPQCFEEVMGKVQKHSALIVDVRDNPGGSGESLKYLIGYLFDHNIHVADRIGRKTLKPLVAESLGRRAFMGRLAVLVNSESSSASELFARVVQVEKRGLVVGDRTAGRVMEARRYTYTFGQDKVVPYGLSLTEANLIMKDGKSLEHTGVIPDEIVLPTAADMTSGRDPALSRAAAMLGVAVSPEDAGKLFPDDLPRP